MTTASGILKMYRYVVMVFVPFFFLCQFPFTVLQAQSISGTVYNDVNGLTDNQVNGTAMGNPNGATLYASLSNASGLVIQTVAIAANGNFQFNSLASGTYHIQISVNAGSIGQPLPGVVLPFGWIITGEFLGAGAGSDGNPNGTLNSIILGSTPLTNAFFGIEQRPSAGTYSFVPQVNPGGPAMVPVDPSAFSGSDPSGGFITAIRLNNFPNNAAGLTINGIFYNSATFPAGGITIPATSTGQPLQPILIDPLNGNSTAEIYYLVIDNALKASQFYGLVSMPFYTISLGGTVWNDVNGLSDNTVNGIAIGAPSSVPLFVNALNSSGNVIAVSSVNAAGTFLFPQIDPGTYSLQLNTLAGTLASAPPAQVLPTNWVFTGEYAGTGAGSDGLVNGILASVTLVNSTINNAQFGIEERPTAIAGVASSQVNPGLNTVAPVDPTAFGGSDASSGYLTAIHIISFPANANGLQLNSVLYTATSFPVSGVWVPCNPTGQPLQPVGIDPVDGVVTVSLQFSVSDNAGFESLNQATTSFSFFSISIAGQVVNDVNGLTDNTVNTSPGANAIPSALYINLLTPAGYVVASTPVLANGSFEFPTMNAGTYAVQLSMYSGIAGLPAPASQLPNGWIFTGEFVGTGPGSDAMADGILTPVLAGSVNIQDIHMGIEEYGTPAVLSTVGQVNPGYGILIPVAPNLFAGTDPSGGSIQGLNITGFPTNVDSLFVNGIAYNASNFPSNGIFIPAAGNGNSLWPISFDPVDGAVSV
ncbi:MAG TPA: hypothetical protein PLP34_05575, partial [Chitinophagaceae bacterium]|nr:hypothetical protein [Chitinophagaceae bacterium]